MSIGERIVIKGGTGSRPAPVSRDPIFNSEKGSPILSFLGPEFIGILICGQKYAILCRNTKAPILLSPQFVIF